MLRAGGIVAYPTETFYGLGALVTRPDALRRLTEAKLRPEGKALPLVAGDMAQVEAVASLADPLARRLAHRFWPGPLTLVIPASPSLDASVTGGGATVGVRIPGSETARALALAAGGALVSTSANVSGEPPPVTPDALSPELLGRIDAVVEGGATPGLLPSTVVAVEGGRALLLREGAVPWQAVEAVARGA